MRQAAHHTCFKTKIGKICSKRASCDATAPSTLAHAPPGRYHAAKTHCRPNRLLGLDVPADPPHAKPAMEFEELSVGLVVQTDWDARPLRVLAFDRAEFLYDCWWPHVGGWGLQNLRGKAYYYRTSTQFLLTRAKALRVDPLTDVERLVHRPDLPLRVLRFAELEWGDAVASSLDEFSSWLSASAPAVSISKDDLALDIPVVALAPFGPKGGLKKPISIAASNGANFSSLELLWQAARLQGPTASQLRHGVGIYRLGYSTGRPLFYLWGFHDRAGIV